MKRTLKITLSLLLTLACMLTIAACGNDNASENLWDNATYTENTELGEGSKVLNVEFKVEDKLISFEIKTDAATVGEALLENGLISGDEGAYGMYVKVVNGITADYDVNASYWSFYINDEYAMTGVDQTEIDESAVYRLEYTK